MRPALFLLLATLFQLLTGCQSSPGPQDDLTPAQWVQQVTKISGKLLSFQDDESNWFSSDFLPLVKKGNQVTRRSRLVKNNHKNMGPQRDPNSLADEIREFVSGVHECYGSIGLSLSVVYQGQVILAEGFGVNDLATQEKTNKDTMFSIGSTTKAFSSTLAAMAVGEGKLTWDAPVREVVPEFRLENDFADGRANLRDLFAHRVGLPRNDFLWVSKPNVTREVIISRLRHLPSHRDFRDQLEYNNWMVFVAGYTAAKVLGGSWEEVVSERIFRPLNMTRTTPGVEDALLLGNVASCYIVGLREVDPLPADVNNVITLVAPAGAIHSSAVDMAQWMNFQLSDGVTDAGERLVSSAALGETYLRQFAMGRGVAGYMMEPLFPVSFYMIDSGLGWFSATYRGRDVRTHSGSTIGHTTLVFLIPGEDLGVYMSGNNQRVDGRVEALVSLFVTDLLLGLDPWLDVPAACGFPCSVADCWDPLPDEDKELSPVEERAQAQWLRAHLPPLVTEKARLEEYVGTYYDPGYDTLRVTMPANGTLYLEWNEPRGALVSIAGEAEDLLFFLPEDWYGLMASVIPVQFNRGPNGEVISVTVASFEPLAPPVFIKQ